MVQILEENITLVVCFNITLHGCCEFSWNLNSNCNIDKREENLTESTDMKLHAFFFFFGAFLFIYFFIYFY